MKNLNDMAKFVELRAQDLSLEAISGEIHVSKPLLIKWNKELSKDIKEARAIKFRKMLEANNASDYHRASNDAKFYSGSAAAIAEKDFKTMDLNQLISVNLKYGNSLRKMEEQILKDVPEVSAEEAPITHTDEVVIPEEYAHIL